MKRGLAIASVLLLLGGCTRSTSSVEAHHAEIRIAEFNIEYGGVVVDWDQTVAVARALDADVIAIEEAWGHIPRLAEALGWPYYDVRRQIVSQLPLLHAPNDPMGYIYVEVAPGQVVAVGNVHLASGSYGPNRVRTGDTAHEVIAGERKVRLPQIEPYGKALAELGAAGVPSFLVGDYNSPSQLDWTQEAVGTRPQIVYPLDWPVTQALADLGFTDSYRQVHPDPVADPGITWPADRPPAKNDGWNPGTHAAEDRIDYVQSIGPATALDSIVVGEDTVDPWPSDHRALVSTFDVTPAPAPDLVSADQLVSGSGVDVTLRFHSAAGNGDVTITSQDGASAATAPVSSVDGSTTVATTGWKAGRYDVSLTDATGATVGTTAFWLTEPGGGPTLRVPATIAHGDPIRVSWTAAPGDRWDWIGIYRRGADPHVAYYLLWTYTDGTVQGSASLGRDAVGRFPLPPGRYTAMLLVDDSYRPVATADFDIS
jgi:endonuclease/exonuclease/phosphatase family metal-dependent hydrolase